MAKFIPKFLKFIQNDKFEIFPECFHIRKLGKGIHTSDDEQALEFDLSNPGSILAYADLDLSSCTGIETAVKMPEDSDFKRKPGLLTAVFEPQDVIRFLVSELFIFVPRTLVKVFLNPNLHRVLAQVV